MNRTSKLSYIVPENFWINPCDPVVYHGGKGWLLHVHPPHPIYPYVETSGHNMQRSLVKWALFTFIPRHSQWRERIPTLTDVLILFSEPHCSQFEVRNQSDPFNRVALFRRQPRTCERVGYRRHLNSHWYVYKNIVWNLPWRLRARCPSIFSSIAIELNVPRDDFSSIAIELLSSWDTVLKKPVQSSIIFVRLG